MSTSTRKFGFELQRYLNSRHMMEMDLVRGMIAMGNCISRQYVYMIVRNERCPPPDMIEKISDALKLARDERTTLHRAAAIDSGYRIGALRA